VPRGGVSTTSSRFLGFPVSTGLPRWCLTPVQWSQGDRPCPPGPRSLRSSLTRRSAVRHGDRRGRRRHRERRTLRPPTGAARSCCPGKDDPPSCPSTCRAAATAPGAGSPRRRTPTRCEMARWRHGS
jgi:hypothetical protein